MDQQLHLRGVSLDIHWKLVECRPGKLAVWEGRGPARSRAHTEYVLRPAGDGGTHFDYHNEFHAPLGPIGAIVSRALVGGIPEREATARSSSCAPTSIAERRSSARFLSFVHVLAEFPQIDRVR